MYISYKKHNGASFLSCLAAAALLCGVQGCSEWTEPESLAIRTGSLEEQNPEKWEQYLQNLRDYKQTDHRRVVGWFDNSSSVIMGKADRLVALPDSLDAVVLMYPDLIDQWEVEEMKEIQEDKGTKVLYCIDYSAILSEYQASHPEEGAETSGDSGEDVQDGFTGYLTSALDRYLPMCDQYGFDGISVRYEPMNLSHLEASEAEVQSARQELFESKIAEWLAGHADRMFVLESTVPFLVGDESITSSADCIAIPNETAETTGEYTTSVLAANVGSVPSDRFMIIVSTVSPDENDVKTGYVTGTDGEKAEAIAEAVIWTVSSTPDIDKYGLGIYNVQNDYYNADFIYPATRRAITEISRSPKL